MSFNCILRIETRILVWLPLGLVSCGFWKVAQVIHRELPNPIQSKQEWIFVGYIIHAFDPIIADPARPVATSRFSLFQYMKTARS